MESGSYLTGTCWYILVHIGQGHDTHSQGLTASQTLNRLQMVSGLTQYTHTHTHHTTHAHIHTPHTHTHTHTHSSTRRYSLSKCDAVSMRRPQCTQFSVRPTPQGTLKCRTAIVQTSYTEFSANWSVNVEASGRRLSFRYNFRILGSLIFTKTRGLS
jgi:hypothetical protein